MSNIVEIGDLRIQRAKRQPSSLALSTAACKHLHMTFDPNGDVVTCDDCSKQLSAFWVMTRMVEQYERAVDTLHAKQRQFAEDKAKELSLLAAQRVEKAWRSRSMVPTCPHCHEAIFPQDGFGGSATNRELALRRREVKAQQ